MCSLVGFGIVRSVWFNWVKLCLVGVGPIWSREVGVGHSGQGGSSLVDVRLVGVSRGGSSLVGERSILIGVTLSG